MYWRNRNADQWLILYTLVPLISLNNNRAVNIKNSFLHNPTSTFVFLAVCISSLFLFTHWPTFSLFLLSLAAQNKAFVCVCEGTGDLNWHISLPFTQASAGMNRVKAWAGAANPFLAHSKPLLWHATLVFLTLLVLQNQVESRTTGAFRAENTNETVAACLQV